MGEQRAAILYRPRVRGMASLMCPEVVEHQNMEIQLTVRRQ